MTIYIGLLFAIVIIYFGLMSLRITQEKKKKYFLNTVFCAIYLLCVLRASSVGRDVAGYERAYLLTKYIAWGNFSYIYFERGYILLMKICLSLGCSFQGFLCIVYAIILTPVYLLIRKHSNNMLFSVLIFVCYIFFEFYLTGIRQALAMSIALYGYIVFLESEKFNVSKYLFFVSLAVFFHKGAIVCYIFVLLLPIKSLKKYTLILLFGTIISMFARNYIFLIIKAFFSKEAFNLNAGLYLGGNIIFLTALSIMFLVVQIDQEKHWNAKIVNNRLKEIYRSEYKVHDANIKMFLIGLLLALFFGEETSARSYMFFSQIIIIQLPNCIDRLEFRLKFLMNLFFYIFLILFFFTNTLIPNNFDIVPYRFFWQ